jgi:hypothetical protein
MKEEVVHTTATYPTAYPATAPTVQRRISWGAIIAGLIVSLVCQILLTMLGVAIGAATIDPLSEQRPMEGMGIGAAVWWLVSGLISLFLGGCVAGRLAGIPRKADGALHGIIMWGTATLITILLFTTALGGVLGGAMSMFRNVSTQANAGQGAPASQIGGQIQSELQQRGLTPEQLKEQGQQKANELQQKANDPQTEQQVREKGDKAAKGVSQAATWTFVALLLGAAVAAWGGSASAPRELRVTTTDRTVVQPAT